MQQKMVQMKYASMRILSTLMPARRATSRLSPQASRRRPHMLFLMRMNTPANRISMIQKDGYMPR